MRNHCFGMLVFLCLWIAGEVCNAETSTIQIMDSYIKSNNDSSTSYVRLRIQGRSKPGDISSESELILSNDCKNFSEKPQVFQNAERTITGFTASNARDNYKINVIYISTDGKQIIDRDFNLTLAEMLKMSSAGTKFDPSGLYLENILGRNLYIGFKSDSGKGSFKVQVQLQPNGHLEMVPNSLKLDN